MTAILVSTFYSPTSLTTAEKQNWATGPCNLSWQNIPIKAVPIFQIRVIWCPDYPLKEGFGYISKWADIGDPADVCIWEALYLITGDINYKTGASPSLSQVKSITTNGRNASNPRDVRRRSGYRW